MYWNYLISLLRHKWFVMIECFKMKLYWKGIMHDISKFLPSEFIPYAKYFYGKYDYNQINNCEDSKLVEEIKSVLYNFDIAWLLHQKRNNHHWQYWILEYDDPGQRIMNMPVKVMKEMICD